MDYVRLGRSGLEVSRLALGCMSYGAAAGTDRGSHAWSLSLEESRPFFVQALEAGITFFDTADVYAGGASEEVTGKLLGELTTRDEVVIATKVHGRRRPGPNGAGLSRAAIMAAVDASLRRLGTDHIDLYQIHRFDPAVPPEEIMQALDDLVRAGKVRYLGASSMYAWQFALLQHTAAENGWTRFVSMQNHLNLLYREEEREMIPYCLATGVGLVPWSPLARGRLARGLDSGSARSQADGWDKTLYQDPGDSIAGALAEVAAARDLPPAQIALAWVLQHAGVTAPIVGATRPGHLTDALAALELELTADEVATLEKPYTPREISGFA